MMAFRVYPAIDLKGGRVVRLKQGRKEDETVYFEDALEPARRFREAGADWVHVVDLDGAFEGVQRNREVVAALAGAGMNVQLGGGVRDLETIRELLALGVKRVVTGTAAIRDAAFLRDAIAEFGEAIAVGIDAKDGKVAIEGWVETVDRDAVDFAQEVVSRGVRTLIYTDISRDGMLTGPNFDAQEALARKVPEARLIASGGVASIEDVVRFRKMGEVRPNLDGVIVGKAIYDGRVQLDACF